MERTTVSSHAELTQLILITRESKDRQETALADCFRDFADSLSPFEVMKSAVHKLTEDKGVQFDLVKGGMNLGANFLIEKVFNKGGIKGFMSSVVLEKLSSSFISANAGGILTGITNFFSPKEKQSDPQNESKDEDSI